MLRETIKYHRNTHFSIGFSNIYQEPPHYHREMEMTLVLKGSVRYKVHHQEYFVAQGQIIVVDTWDLHRIVESSKDVVMLTFHVDLEQFANIYPNIEFMIFACGGGSNETPEHRQRMQNKIALLADHVAEIMMICQNDGDNSLLLNRKIHQFIQIMVNQFQGFVIEDNEFRAGDDDVNPMDLDRMYRIISYMYTHYTEKITLQDLAKMEHLNMYYISHVIRKTTGLNFQKFMNYIRMEYSEKELYDNRLTLTQISENCGFSSPAYFNKIFKEWHGVTPSAYRKAISLPLRKSHGYIDQGKAMELLANYTSSQKAKGGSEKVVPSPEHLVIRVPQQRKRGRDFHRTFPLHLAVISRGDIIGLMQYKEEIMKIRPARIMVAETKQGMALCGSLEKNIISQLKEMFLKQGIILEICQQAEEIPLYAHRETAAAAFSEEVKNPWRYLTIVEQQIAPEQREDSQRPAGLFTFEGWPTVWYFMHHSLAQVEGVVEEQRKDCLLIRGDAVRHLLASRQEAVGSLDIHLEFQSIDYPESVWTWRLTSQQNVESVKALSKTLPEKDSVLGKQIVTYLKGDTEYQPVAMTPGLRWDTTVSPGIFVMETFVRQEV